MVQVVWNPVLAIQDFGAHEQRVLPFQDHFPCLLDPGSTKGGRNETAVLEVDLCFQLESSSCRTFPWIIKNNCNYHNHCYFPLYHLEKGNVQNKFYHAGFAAARIAVLALREVVMPALAMLTVCCSITSWIAVLSDSSILSNSSIAQIPISASTWNPRVCTMRLITNGIDCLRFTPSNCFYCAKVIILQKNEMECLPARQVWNLNCWFDLKNKDLQPQQLAIIRAGEQSSYIHLWKHKQVGL